MSDRADQVDRLAALLGELRGQPPPAPFVPAAAVRRRGRRRTYRQLATVASAVVAVTGLAGGAVVATTGPLAGDPEPAAPGPVANGSPTPSTDRTDPTDPTGPAVTAIPAEWLLTAGDLEPGEWAPPAQDPFELENGPWIWLQRCVFDLDFAAAQEAYPSLRDRRDLALVAWEDGRKVAGEPGWRVHQTVELFDSEPAAVANLADVAAVTEGCQEPGWRVRDRDYAGDASLLVAEEEAAAGGWRYAVVRVGAVVVTLMSTDEELLRGQAVPAAVGKLP